MKFSTLFYHFSGPFVLGSPSGQQKAIHDFFSVTKVISSSPHKSSAMPSTSTHRAGSGVVFEDDEEDDDVSLLATPTAAEINAEDEDEIDDDSLLAAEMLPEKVSSAEARLLEADYLEGMTAEMFGDDKDFDDLEEEEGEVEPLPDAHFGLLSSDKVLLRPQGCVDDLPEEVLREVLCLVPAADLYRNVCLVCHRWRNIVLDPKVRPTDPILTLQQQVLLLSSHISAARQFKLLYTIKHNSVPNY